MKIRIKETQLNNLLKEVGGYDSPDIMGIHGGNIHGEIKRIISQTVEFMAHFVEGLRDDSLSKNQIMAGVVNFSDKIRLDITRLSELTREIYIDDDFKELMVSFIRALKKTLKYFQLLVNVTPGIIGKQSPEPLIGGLGIDMSKSEISLIIAERLAELGTYIESLGKMFQELFYRFARRMGGDEDDLNINI